MGYQPQVVRAFFSQMLTHDKENNAYSFFPYFYIKWKDALCGNRGGLGGSNSFSEKKKNLQECAAAVARNSDCGPEFSFGKIDGWCDCVPRGSGSCTFFTDDGTKSQAYSVYTACG